MRLICDGILEVGERLLRQGADLGGGDDHAAGGGVILYKVLKVFRVFKALKSVGSLGSLGTLKYLLSFSSLFVRGHSFLDFFCCLVKFFLLFEKKVLLLHFDWRGCMNG